MISMCDNQFMLSSFPSLTLNEFADGCQSLQRRCENNLGETDWLSVRWHQEVLTIRKSYRVNTSAPLGCKVRTDSPEASVDVLADEFGEDEVERSLVYRAVTEADTTTSRRCQDLSSPTMNQSV